LESESRLLLRIVLCGRYVREPFFCFPGPDLVQQFLTMLSVIERFRKLLKRLDLVRPTPTNNSHRSGLTRCQILIGYQKFRIYILIACTQR
jgi:hypothetical protein